MANPKNKTATEGLLAGAPESEIQSLTVKAIESVRPHLKVILAVGVGVVAVVGGLTIYQNMQDKKAGQASRVFGQAVEKSRASVGEGGPQFEMNAQGQPELSTTPSEFKTFAERDQAALAALTPVTSSPIGKNAKLVEAGLLYDLGKYDEAGAAYKAFLDSHPPADLAARAREGQGYALEAKALAQTDAAARAAGLDAALKEFSAIDPDEKGAFHGLGLYHQARLIALKGDKKAAIDLYKKALALNPGGGLSEEINSRLGLLEAN